MTERHEMIRDKTHDTRLETRHETRFVFRNNKALNDGDRDVDVDETVDSSPHLRSHHFCRPFLELGDAALPVRGAACRSRVAVAVA